MGRKPGSDPTTVIYGVITVLWEMAWQTLELLGYVCVLSLEKTVN
jgi:hypothetical protein